MIDVFKTIERYTKFHNEFFGREYEDWPSTVPPELPEAKMWVSCRANLGRSEERGREGRGGGRGDEKGKEESKGGEKRGEEKKGEHRKRKGKKAKESKPARQRHTPTPFPPRAHKK